MIPGVAMTNEDCKTDLKTCFFAVGNSPLGCGGANGAHLAE